WYGAWATSAEKFEGLAKTAEDRGFPLTAGEHYLRASMLFHFAQLFTRPEDPRRREGCKRRVELFRRASPHLSPPVRTVDVAAGELTLPGYFRVPESRTRCSAVLLL